MARPIPQSTEGSHTDVMAALFSPPTHEKLPRKTASVIADVPPPPPPPAAAAAASPPSSTAHSRGRCWWPLSSAGDASRSAPVASEEVTAEDDRGASSAAAAAALARLPVSPLGGYRLDATLGLVDELVQPPRVLTAAEVRHLLFEVSAIEAKAKATVDEHLSPQFSLKVTRGWQSIINPVLLMGGLYLSTWGTASLYARAVPRRSVALEYMVRFLSWRQSNANREHVAQRYRQLLQATNARVVLKFSSGVALLTVGLLTRPPSDIIVNSPEVSQAKDDVSYQQHSELLVKWLWLVYLNHPAYAPHAKNSFL